jgi:hypothetical protein
VIEVTSVQDGGDSAADRAHGRSNTPREHRADVGKGRPECIGQSGLRGCWQADNEWPAQLAISLIQGKWKVRILFQLQHGPIRLSQLRKMFPGAPKKMLTQHLRGMEHDGIVVRSDLSGPSTAC